MLKPRAILSKAKSSSPHSKLITQCTNMGFIQSLWAMPTTSDVAFWKSGWEAWLRQTARVPGVPVPESNHNKIRKKTRALSILKTLHFYAEP